MSFRMPTSFDVAARSVREMAADGPSNATSGELDATCRDIKPLQSMTSTTSRTVGIGPASFLDARKPLVDHARIDESCLQQGCNDCDPSL